MDNNVFRKQYRALTEMEKNHVDAVKVAAEILHHLLDRGDPRCVAIAKTKLEECVMWATKGLT